MPSRSDRQRFLNEDLVLKVSNAVNRVRWNENRYEAFIDELCGTREYQKAAIRTALRYLLGGEYQSLRDLARESFEQNQVLEDRYGTWANFQRQLQLPDHLSASIDLATGTGKSFVLYGIAAILLAEGAVDRVLVLCPSTTIERGLLEKFRQLASNSALRELLPSGSKLVAPSIINASESIVPGSICVENYHAILEHVGSSIRDSLKGQGANTAVLNDEAHHVANDNQSTVRRWKEFLLNPEYGFKYVVGVSGTCYVGNEYFADVIYRYSLRQAIEEKYVKKVAYVAELPRTNDPDEKWQLIRNRHEANKAGLKSRNIRPLTIVVTNTISRCKDLADELRAVLVDQSGISHEDAQRQVLAVYNNAEDVAKLPYVDQASSEVEWIVSVSMLTEGWDVKRVFQIVPHEERAFNSKLLVSQVLGRGLRVPNNWGHGEQPEVTVFNHDNWALRIRYLVDEILELERRVVCQIIDGSPFHFDLHNIDYTLKTIAVERPMQRDYVLFSRGYVDLASEPVEEDVAIEYERVVGGGHFRWQTQIKHKTYTPSEIAVAMYERLLEADYPDEPGQDPPSRYTDTWTIEKLETVVTESLRKREMTVATERMRQKFLQSLGTLRRKATQSVRYVPVVNEYYTVSTRSRPSDGGSASELRNTKTLFYTDKTKSYIPDEQVEFFEEIIEPGTNYKRVYIENHRDFKTPVSAVVVDSDNERRFLNQLRNPDYVDCYDAWIKSTSTRFYEIDYAWKKGNNPKRGKFNPDFFIKIGDLILVLEIKDDLELDEPSEENRKKNEYAKAHFDRVNNYLESSGSPIRYKFNFLTERSFVSFFQALREGKTRTFRSDLDVKLDEEQLEDDS